MEEKVQQGNGAQSTAGAVAARLRGDDQTEGGNMVQPAQGSGKWQDIRPLNRQLQEIINHRRRLIRLSKRHKVR